MKILILGGTQLTGPFILRYLIEQGHPVTIFHRGKHQIDLPQEEALRRTVERQRAHPLEKYDPKDFDYSTEDKVLEELEQTDQPKEKR